MELGVLISAGDERVDLQVQPQVLDEGGQLDLQVRLQVRDQGEQHDTQVLQQLPLAVLPVQEMP